MSGVISIRLLRKSSSCVASLSLSLIGDEQQQDKFLISLELIK